MPVSGPMPVSAFVVISEWCRSQSNQDTPPTPASKQALQQGRSAVPGHLRDGVNQVRKGMPQSQHALS
jgi:hypothetical protein